MKKNNISENFDSNDYHFNLDSKLGIYLIHGFSSSTYEVKKLALHLSEKGYQVRADNLPGHGTTVEDCNSTKYQEWLNSVEKGIAEMYSKCDKVIVIGVSMGGVLSLHLGSLFPLDGIISASALFKFKNEFNVRFINRIFNKIKKTVPKKSTFNPDLVKAQNIQFYGYNHYPLCALNEMRKMIDKVKLTLKKISSPLLLIHSTIDQTAPFENLEIIKQELTISNLETLVVNETGHNIYDTDKNDKKVIFDKIDQFIERIFN
ncbi:MAG: alpha/beta fold hydrolase [Pelagibacteraceae bacterium TMED246]|nr:MAG: alpha/beta fold hydrolase [Pelagibacteraceae bacterium TMED246]